MTAANISKLQKYQKLARFAVLSFLIMWVITLGNLFFFMFLSPNPPFSYHNLNNRLGMADFVRIYVSAKLAASDDRTHIYDYAPQLKIVKSVLKTNEEPEAADSNYTPHMCVMMTPISLLPLVNAFWVWLGSSCLCGFLSMYWILKRERHFNNWTTAITMLAVFGSINSMNVLLTGQTTWFLLTMFTAFYWAMIHQKEVAAGIALAFTTIKPQYSLYFVIGIIAKRRWTALLTFAAAVSIMLGYAAYQLGWENVLNYPKLMSAKEISPEFYPAKMCCMRGLLTMFLPIDTALKASGVIQILSLPFVFKLWMSGKDNIEKRKWTLSITMLLSLVLGTHVNAYDCLLVALPAMLTMPDISPFVIWKIPCKPLKVWSLLMLSYPIAGWALGSNNYVFLPLNIALVISGLMYMASPEMNVQAPEPSSAAP